MSHLRLDPASQRVAERAGFSQEGIVPAELEHNHVRHDTAPTSRLQTDPAPDEPLSIQEDR